MPPLPQQRAKTEQFGSDQNNGLLDRKGRTATQPFGSNIQSPELLIKNSRVELLESTKTKMDSLRGFIDLISNSQQIELNGEEYLKEVEAKDLVGIDVLVFEELVDALIKIHREVISYFSRDLELKDRTNLKFTLSLILDKLTHKIANLKMDIIKRKRIDSDFKGFNSRFNFYVYLEETFLKPLGELINLLDLDIKEKTFRSVPELEIERLSLELQKYAQSILEPQEIFNELNEFDRYRQKVIDLLKPRTSSSEDKIKSVIDSDFGFTEKESLEKLLDLLIKIINFTDQDIINYDFKSKELKSINLSSIRRDIQKLVNYYTLVLEGLDKEKRTEKDKISIDILYEYYAMLLNKLTVLSLAIEDFAVKQTNIGFKNINRIVNRLLEKLDYNFLGTEINNN